MTNDTRSEDDTSAENVSTNRLPTSRRKFLYGAAGAGALAAGIGFGATGSLAQQATTAPPRLHVEGNQVYDADGNQVILRGVNTADPKRLDVTAPARGKNAVQAIDLATDADAGWYAESIRLPVQPVDIGETQPGQGPDPGAFSQDQLDSYLEDHLDAAVEKCAEEGVYCIVDYHRHRDIPWTNDDLSDEVIMFWDTVAARYSDRSHVLFEMFNEPNGNPNYGASGQDLVDFWGTWKDAAQPWVNTIRENAPDSLILVGSPRFTQMPWGALIEEFDDPGAGDNEDNNLAYTLHVYPAHPPDPDMDDHPTYDDFVTPIYYGDDPSNAPYPLHPVYEDYPLFVTEWGYDPNADPYAGGGVNKTADNDGDGEPDTTKDPDYGQDMADWFAKHPISWNTWVFDPIWTPSMMTRTFVGDDPAPIGNPYNDEDGPVPTLCEDQPCEWKALGGDSQGEFVKNLLAERNGTGSSGGTTTMSGNESANTTTETGTEAETTGTQTTTEAETTGTQTTTEAETTGTQTTTEAETTGTQTTTESATEGTESGGGAAAGGNGKSKMGDDGSDDNDGAASGGNGKSKQG